MSDDDEGAGGPQIGDLDVTSAAQIRQLRGLIAAGEVVIFSKREAKTLLKIATFFDVDHDESNLKTVIGIVKVCQTFSAFGVLGHLVISVMLAVLAMFAAVATIANRWPSVDHLLRVLGGNDGSH